MGWIKKLLGFEREELKSEPKEEELVIGEGKRLVEDECVICRQQIGQDRYKKIGENFMHKKCFKKQAKVLLNGG